MLNDTDLSNHRLALTTVNSAIHNKTNLIVPHLNKILPAVINDTRVNPALVREVQMGPFRHKVDDGLEVRKVRINTPEKHKSTNISTYSANPQNYKNRAPTKPSTRV